MLLRSPHSPAECARRLSDRIDHPLQLFGKKPVVGEVSDNWLKLRKRISYGNSFQTFLRAWLEPDGAGTRLRCRLGMSVFTTLFMILWLGMVAFFCVTLVLAALTGAMTPGAPLWGLLVPPGMFAFGVGLLLWGRIRRATRAGSWSTSSAARSTPGRKQPRRPRRRRSCADQDGATRSRKPSMAAK